MEAPDRWADLGFANLLGRYEEAKAHNAPIAAERQRQATVVAAAITSRKAKNSLPTHILLENVPGLAPTSLLLLEQLRTIDRKRLRGYIGRISKEKMLEIDAALAISIGIGYPNERRTQNV